MLLPLSSLKTHTGCFVQNISWVSTILMLYHRIIDDDVIIRLHGYDMALNLLLI